MSITSSVTATNLTRSELWASQLKEVLQDELSGQGYVRWLTEFPDGDTFTIPSIGEATVRDYTENTPIVYDSLDTGEFNFTITEYTSSGLYITKKARQNAFYAAQLEASFVPKESRALFERLETDIFSLADPTASVGSTTQTSNNANTINGADHRFLGADTSNGPGTYWMAVTDFAAALFALKKANVPDSNLIAIVDPSVEFAINTLANLVTLANPSPRWDGIAETGIASGMKFVKNIFGFDVYVNNYLPLSVAADLGSGGYANNIFFSAASPDIIPFLGAWRQMPEVDTEYNKDFQREEYVTTSRYGLDLYRPENLVVVLTDPAIT